MFHLHAQSYSVPKYSRGLPMEEGGGGREQLHPDWPGVLVAYLHKHLLSISHRRVSGETVHTHRLPVPRKLESEVLQGNVSPWRLGQRGWSLTFLYCCCTAFMHATASWGLLRADLSKPRTFTFSANTLSATSVASPTFSKHFRSCFVKMTHPSL